MKKYWKVKLIDDMLKIISEEQEGAIVTMKWRIYQEELREVMLQAYEAGWENALKERSNWF